MRYSDSWVVSDEWKINNKTVTAGAELSFRGERGRFKFVKHVINGDHEWVEVLGSDMQFHSFRPDKLKTVHRIKKLR